MTLLKLRESTLDLVVTISDHHETDSAYYGGSNFGLKFGAATAEAIPAHGRAYSIVLRLPPLYTVFLAPVGPSGGRNEASPWTARRGRLV